MITVINEKSFFVNPDWINCDVREASYFNILHELFTSRECRTFRALRAVPAETLFCIADFSSGVFTFVNPDEISGEFDVVFSHERLICVAPSGDFENDALSGRRFHKSALMSVEHEGQSFMVLKGTREEELFCPQCGEFLPGNPLKIRIDGENFCGGECASAAGYEHCADCEEWHSVDDMTEFNGEYFCASCFAENFSECEECGKIFRREDAPLDARRLGYCSDECALSAGYTHCAECGELVHEDAAEGINGSYYCRECAENEFTRCDSCGEYVPRGNAYDIEGYSFCSTECAENRGFCFCEECGESINVNSEHVVHFNTSGKAICYDCARKYVRDTRFMIRRYSDNPAYRFLHTTEDEPGKRLYMGFEIEFFFPEYADFNNAVPELIEEFSNKKDNLIFFKHDGSIGVFGAEAVSMPCTLAWIKKNADIFKNFFEILCVNGMDPHDFCGMHVHLSRAGMSEEHEVRLELFFARFAHLIERVAGRAPQEYCERVNIFGAFTPDAVRRHKIYSGRYRALNWQNERTVEIRAYKCPETYDDFMVKLEFSHAVYQFTKMQSFDDIETADVVLFYDFVKNNAEKYNHLNDFLNK